MLRMWWARWSIWIVGCALATAIVIGNAFYQKKQFYPTVVYITKSKPSMAVMYAQALLFVVMLGKLFRKLFFGQLRAAEFEHLVERSWYAVTETCLAFTVFRDDFSPKFLALFTLLLFLKSFHWLAEERVDYMERSPVITWVFHVRVLSLLSILLLTDIYFVNVAYQSTVTKGASVQLVFGFEYAILTTIVLNTVAKYVFHVVDMQNETPWENKAVFVLHTEVVIGLFKVVLYILFVLIMVRVYTLPLFALRPTYLALRAFKKAVNDVIMSRRAINNMNNLYPDVTLEELAATDNVCIICREEMTGGAKKLPCNHIFHVSCLRSWFQRQQTCPTCRLNVLRVPAAASAAAAAAAAAAGGGGGVAAPGAGGVQGQNFGAFMVNQFPGFGGQGQGQQMFRPGQMPPQPFGGMWGNFPQQWANQQPPQGQAAAAAQGQGVGGGDQGQNEAAGAGGGGAAAAGGDAQNQPGGGDAAAAAAGPRAPFPGAQFPAYFGMPPQPQFAFRPQAPAAAAAAAGAGQGQTGDFMAGGAPPTQPFAYPFTFPPMPYIPLVPPPPPLLETTGLSTEELQRMEGITRDNIEARLRCLRNVQILLDSAVVQMQQYSAVVAHLNIPPPSSATTEEPVAGSSGAAAAAAAASTSSFQDTSSKTSPPSTLVPESTASTIPPPPPKNEVSATPEATSAKTNGGVKEVITPTSTSPKNVSEGSATPNSSGATDKAVPPSTELDELRKRRLARLSPSSTTNQNQSEAPSTTTSSTSAADGGGTE